MLVSFAAFRFHPLNPLRGEADALHETVCALSTGGFKHYTVPFHLAPPFAAFSAARNPPSMVYPIDLHHSRNSRQTRSSIHGRAFLILATGPDWTIFVRSSREKINYFR